MKPKSQLKPNCFSKLWHFGLKIIQLQALASGIILLRGSDTVTWTQNSGWADHGQASSDLDIKEPLQVKNHFWDRSQNWTTFGTGGFGVTESDVVGHFESYKARVLPLYVRRARMCGPNLD